MTRRIPPAEALFLAGVLVMAGIVVTRPRIPISTGALALAIALAFGLAAGVCSFIAERRKRRSEFDSREPITADEVFARYYADSGLDKRLVVRFWNECAAQLRLQPEKLRPTDRFERELATIDFWTSLDDPREDLARYAAALAEKHGANLNLKDARTLDELIRQLVAIATQRPCP